MQSGKKFGMQTLNDALYQLYVTRLVTADECVRSSSDPNEFLRMIGKGPGEDVGGPAERRSAERAVAGARK
jgi:twitching motility protein PilT